MPEITTTYSPENASSEIEELLTEFKKEFKKQSDAIKESNENNQISAQEEKIQKLVREFREKITVFYIKALLDENNSLIKKAYEALLELAQLAPNVFTLGSYEDEPDDQIYVSTGHQLSLKEIIANHNSRAYKGSELDESDTSKLLLNPVTYIDELIFSPQDRDHILNIIKEKTEKFSENEKQANDKEIKDIDKQIETLQSIENNPTQNTSVNIQTIAQQLQNLDIDNYSDEEESEESSDDEESETSSSELSEIENEENSAELFETANEEDPVELSETKKKIRDLKLRKQELLVEKLELIDLAEQTKAEVAFYVLLKANKLNLLPAKLRALFANLNSARRLIQSLNADVNLTIPENISGLLVLLPIYQLRKDDLERLKKSGLSFGVFIKSSAEIRKLLLGHTFKIAELTKPNEQSFCFTCEQLLKLDQAVLSVFLGEDISTQTLFDIFSKHIKFDDFLKLQTSEQLNFLENQNTYCNLIYNCGFSLQTIFSFPAEERKEIVEHYLEINNILKSISLKELFSFKYLQRLALYQSYRDIQFLAHSFYLENWDVFKQFDAKELQNSYSEEARVKLARLVHAKEISKEVIIQRLFKYYQNYVEELKEQLKFDEQYLRQCPPDLLAEILQNSSLIINFSTLGLSFEKLFILDKNTRRCLFAKPLIISELSSAFRTSFTSFITELKTEQLQDLFQHAKQAVQLAKYVSFEELKKLSAQELKIVLSDAESEESQHIIFSIKLTNFITTLEKNLKNELQQDILQVIDLLKKIVLANKNTDRQLVNNLSSPLNKLFVYAAINDNYALKNVASQLLIALAELLPVNNTDPISGKEISLENQISVSTGHKYDLKTLVDNHNSRKLRSEDKENKILFNWAINTPFSTGDAKHILQEIEKFNALHTDKIEILNLDPIHIEVEEIFDIFSQGVELGFLPSVLKNYISSFGKSCLAHYNRNKVHSITENAMIILTLDSLLASSQPQIDILGENARLYIEVILELPVELRSLLLEHAFEIALFIKQEKIAYQEVLNIKLLERIILQGNRVLELAKKLNVTALYLFEMLSVEELDIFYTLITEISYLKNKLKIPFKIFLGLSIEELQQFYSEQTQERLAALIESEYQVPIPKDLINLLMAEAILEKPEAKVLWQIGFGFNDFLAYPAELLDKIVRNVSILSKLIPKHISTDEFLQLKPEIQSQLLEYLDEIIELFEHEILTSAEDLEKIQFALIPSILNKSRSNRAESIITALQHTTKSLNAQTAENDNNTDEFQPDRGLKNLAAIVGKKIKTKKQEKEFLQELFELCEETGKEDKDLHRFMYDIIDREIYTFTPDSQRKMALLTNELSVSAKHLKESPVFIKYAGFSPLQLIAILGKPASRHRLYNLFIENFKNSYSSLNTAEKSKLREMAVYCDRKDDLELFLKVDLKTVPSFTETVLKPVLNYAITVRNFDIIKMLSQFKDSQFKAEKVFPPDLIPTLIARHDFALLEVLVKFMDVNNQYYISIDTILESILTNKLTINFINFTNDIKSNKFNISALWLLTQLHFFENNQIIEKKVAEFIRIFDLEARKITDHVTPSTCNDLLYFSFFLYQCGFPHFLCGLINHYADILKQADETEWAQLERIAQFIQRWLQVAISMDCHSTSYKNIESYNLVPGYLPGLPELDYQQQNFNSDFQNLAAAAKQEVIKEEQQQEFMEMIAEERPSRLHQTFPPYSDLLSHAIFNNAPQSFTILIYYYLNTLFNSSFFITNNKTHIQFPTLIALLNRKELQDALFHELTTNNRYVFFNPNNLDESQRMAFIQILIICGRISELEKELHQQFAQTSRNKLTMFRSIVAKAMEMRNFEILKLLVRIQQTYFQSNTYFTYEALIPFLKIKDFKMLAALMPFTNKKFRENVDIQFSDLLRHLLSEEVECSSLLENIETAFKRQEFKKAKPLIDLVNFDAFNTPGNIKKFIALYKDEAEIDPQSKSCVILMNFASLLQDLGCDSFYQALLDNHLLIAFAKPRVVDKPVGNIDYTTLEKKITTILNRGEKEYTSYSAIERELLRYQKLFSENENSLAILQDYLVTELELTESNFPQNVFYPLVIAAVQHSPSSVMFAALEMLYQFRRDKSIETDSFEITKQCISMSLHPEMVATVFHFENDSYHSPIAFKELINFIISHCDQFDFSNLFQEVSEKIITPDYPKEILNMLMNLMNHPIFNNEINIDYFFKVFESEFQKNQDSNTCKALADFALFLHNSGCYGFLEKIQQFNIPQGVKILNEKKQLEIVSSYISEIKALRAENIDLSKVYSLAFEEQKEIFENTQKILPLIQTGKIQFEEFIKLTAEQRELVCNNDTSFNNTNKNEQMVNNEDLTMTNVSSIQAIEENVTASTEAITKQENNVDLSPNNNNNNSTIQSEDETPISSYIQTTNSFFQPVPTAPAPTVKFSEFIEFIIYNNVAIYFDNLPVEIQKIIQEKNLNKNEIELSNKLANFDLTQFNTPDNVAEFVRVFESVSKDISVSSYLNCETLLNFALTKGCENFYHALLNCKINNEAVAFVKLYPICRQHSSIVNGLINYLNSQESKHTGLVSKLKKVIEDSVKALKENENIIHILARKICSGIRFKTSEFPDEIRIVSDFLKILSLKSYYVNPQLYGKTNVSSDINLNNNRMPS